MPSTPGDPAGHPCPHVVGRGERATLAGAAAAIEEQPPALVGPISFWELTVLTDRGRIAVNREVSQWCRDLLTSGVVQVATLTPLAAIPAARLREFHGDPADRFIYATTRELAVPLCSKDAQIRAVRRPAG